MIYYRCYDAHADRNRRWALTDRRWRIAFSKNKEQVRTHDEICHGLLMHGNGNAMNGLTTVYASCKALRKEDLPKPCQDSLDEYMAGYETEEVL